MLKTIGVVLAVLLVPALGYSQSLGEGAQPDPSAKVACKAGGYFYWACQATSESPEGQGIGAAAARYAACLKSSTEPKSKIDDAVVPIVFKGLSPQQVVKSVECPFDPNDPAELPGAKPVYLRPSKPVKIEPQIYPKRAQDLGITGAVVLECKAVENRFQNCRILREYPLGFGFGAAAQRTAALLELRPLDESNQPVDGRLFRFPMNFNLR
jgi:hypothetical protein